ncbi:hypothetical protein [Tepidibacter aestuarii]|uniref:hypothetical protein n=1 Tax=Tepidibacter aestuarii TaxID=2925782 RepID=UPI0020BE2858|nr:hypothetical protein [Tepidibacter aestuarii]
MAISEHFLYLLAESWDIALWTGAWYVFPVWILIEFSISTATIFFKHKKSKEVSCDNWEKGYFKRLGSIGLFLLAVRTFLTMVIIFIPTSTSIAVSLFSLVKFLLVAAFLASAATVWILVKFHPVQSARAKAYLALLSIPIVFFYSVAISIMLF